MCLSLFSSLSFIRVHPCASVVSSFLSLCRARYQVGYFLEKLLGGLFACCAGFGYNGVYFRS